ncbi:MAG TPA: DUF4340 domain-containing protein, partial [Thermoanaerobaculia bacterium]|nr:DUF4340 domain-containing protein [Thermoanaerobaculia bacterium]
LVKPESYPADASPVMDLVRELASLKRAGGDPTGARPDAYGLVPPVAKATFTWSEEAAPQKKKIRTVEFGIEIPAGDTAAARVAGTENVIFVRASALAAVKKSVNDFKSREVFGGSASDIAAVDIERGRGHLVLAKKGGSWWLQQPVNDLADSGVATRLAEDLLALRAVDFVGSADRENLATQGLNPPVSRVTLVDAKGVRSTVDLGATRSDGNSVYARRETQVLTVHNAIVDELSKEAIAFREAHLVMPDRSAVSGLDGEFGDGKFTFVKSGATWTAAGKPIPSPAADDVLSALLDLKSKTFIDEPDAARLRALAPAATIRLTVAPESWEIKLYTVRSDIQASVARRPGGFLMPPDSLSRLLDAFKKASSSQPTPVPTVPPAPTPKRK